MESRSNPSEPPSESRRLRPFAMLFSSLVQAVLLPAALLATGAVSGVVLDGRTGQPVRGATLAFEGTEVASETDLNGVFQARLEDGTYVATVSAEGFETQKVVAVVVRSEQDAHVSVVLVPAGDAPAGVDVPAAGISEEITVQADAVEATAAAMLTERKASAQIIDNIGSEEIAKNSGSDAASALRRVTGISLQDDKYVFVRGLGDRYSNTQLNGTKLPSTEFERKTVPLDLFAADLLEKVTVSKSYTADQPGDFVAGVVELETKQFPPRQHFSLGAKAGHNTATTGEPWLIYPGGVSSSGSGGQQLPSGIPDDPLLRTSIITSDGFTPAELEAFGEDLIGDWSPDPDEGPWDRGFKASYGNSFGRVGLLLSAGADNDHAVREEQRAYYTIPAPGRPVDRTSLFDFDYGIEQARQSLMGNLAVRAGDNSQVRFRGLFTSLSEAEGRFQEGSWPTPTATSETTAWPSRSRKSRTCSSRATTSSRTSVRAGACSSGAAPSRSRPPRRTCARRSTRTAGSTASASRTSARAASSTTTTSKTSSATAAPT